MRKTTAIALSLCLIAAIEYEDPSGILSGAPALYADSSTELDFDNVQVMVNR